MFRRAVVWLAFSVGAGTGASALTACSLLLGEGFTDPNAEQPANDSGPGGSDAPNGGDGSTPTTEGGPGVDGSPPGTDGGLLDGGDSGGVTCPVAVVSFCDDFERNSQSNLKGAWDVVDLNLSGSLSIVAGPTGNRHLATSVNAPGGQAQLSKTFSQQPTRLRFELSLRVKAFASVGAVYVAGVGMGSSGGPFSLIYFYVETDSLWLVQQVGGGGGYYRSPVPVSTGTTHRIVVDLTFNGKVSVKVDGSTKVDEDARTYLVPKPPSLYLGASSIDSTGDDGNFEIDNFVFAID